MTRQAVDSASPGAVRSAPVSTAAGGRPLNRISLAPAPSSPASRLSGATPLRYGARRVRRGAQRRWVICFTAVLALHAAPMFWARSWRGSPAGETAPSLAAPPVAAILIYLTPTASEASEPKASRRPEVRRHRVPTASVVTPVQPLPAEAIEPVESRTDLGAPASMALAGLFAAGGGATNAADPVRAVKVSTAAAPASKGPATWQGAVLARLERFKRYPALARVGRQAGVAYLHVAMDRQGGVLSARIDRSSGSVVLDDEAMALVRRAAPLPAPPPEVVGDPLELTVPIEFSLAGR